MSYYFFCEKQNWETPRILLQIVLGSQLRTPVGDEEKELHRNSMRRELDSALKLSNLTDTSLGNNESCESLETPVLDRRQVNHTSHEPGETDQVSNIS